ncbi:MAG: flagellar biosynthetic protein FliO [Candidatus Acidiferrales bacterium]
MEFVRGAFGRIARPSLWKKRRELSICETLSLGNRNFVAVIGYQDQRFLIAGTANSISLLSDVTCERAAAHICDEGDAPAD